MSVVFVYATFPDADTAQKICGELISQKLAACANILGEGRSLYWWDGKLQNEPEVYAILKTAAETYPSLENRIKELHSYDTPCIVSWTIEQGSKEFLDWVRDHSSLTVLE